MRTILLRLWRHRPLRLAFIALTVLLLTGGLAPYLPIANPFTPDILARFSLPSATHWLGTDALGRDLFSRLLWGIRTSVGIALLTMIITAVIGIGYGTLAAVARPARSGAMMRLADVMMAFPSEVMILALVGVMGPGVSSIVLACVVANWPWYARLTRNHVKKLLQTGYVQNALVSGASWGYLIRRHVLASAMGEFSVLMTIDAGAVILMITTLSFLGLGIQPPTPEWGMMLAESKEVINLHPWQAWLPGLAIMSVTALFNGLGDLMREALDARYAINARTAPAERLLSAMSAEEHALAEALTRRAPVPAHEHLLRVKALTLTGRTPEGEPLTLLDGLTFDLHPHEGLALLGESGTGKTLTALALAGLNSAALRVMGEIRLADQVLLDAQHDRRAAAQGKTLLYIVQNAMTAFNPQQRLEAQLLEALQLAEPHIGKAAAHERLRSTLRTLRFDDPERMLHALPSMLSGGQLQRLQVAVALLMHPAVVVVDEPTASLDTQAARQVAQSLATLKASGVALIVITHDLLLAKALCERYVLLDAGSVVEYDDMASFGSPDAEHPLSAALERARQEKGRVLSAQLVETQHHHDERRASRETHHDH